MVQEVEDFYGVYLLYCINPRYKGRTYIGYTTDPNRRIKQHNSGSHAGGAWRTSGRGPWDMVLIIHGFPNNISALRFEWAWQHPDKCRRLRNVPVAKKTSESAFQHRWRVMCHMLHAVPWQRLALTIRWLKQDYQLEFPANLAPPLHMPIAFGLVHSKKILVAKSSKQNSPTKAMSSSEELELGEQAAEETIPVLKKTVPVCVVCHRKIKADDIRLVCFLPNCTMVSHIICLSSRFIGEKESKHLIPLEGSCPVCRRTLLWGDLIRHYKGCYQNLPHLTQRMCGNFHWADMKKNNN